MSRDEKKKVNLEKAVQSVKNDKVIVNGLSEAIVLGKVSTYVNFWITTPGIVTIVTGIVGIMSILANLYLLNKIRYLLIAVAILKTTIMKTNAKTLDLKFRNQESSEIENTQMWHEIIQQGFKEISLQHMSMFVSFVIVCLLMSIVYKLWKKQRHVSFHFAIEIISNNTYYYMNICKLHGNMKDCIAESTEYIKDMTVEGWIRPTLKFKWKNLKMTDQITEVETKVKEKITLTWKEARKLRKLFQHDFTINPVLKQDGKIKRIMIQEGRKEERNKNM